MTAGGELISIGELSAETGLSPALIRRWESRYGYPVAVRAGAGHRRYDAATVDVVQTILRKRDSGLQLSAAVADALGRTAPANPSLYSCLTAEHPEVPALRLSMATVLALSQAIEDQCFATAGEPLMFGLFQEQSNYEPAAERWNDLATMSRATYVYADFPDLARDSHPESGKAVVRVGVSPTSHLRQEWAVICDSAPGRDNGDPSAMPIAMVARESPGQDQVASADRVFDTAWSFNPAVVREVSRTCARVARDTDAPGSEELVTILADGPGEELPATPAAAALFARVVGYLDPGGRRPV